MIKTNYLFFWQVIKETFSKTQGYIGLFAIGYIFIDFIYPQAWRFFMNWAYTVLITPATFETSNVTVTSNKIFYLFSFIKSWLKDLFIIGGVKVTVDYLTYKKFSPRSYLFSFHHFIDTLFFSLFFGFIFVVVDFLMSMALIEITLSLYPKAFAFTTSIGFIQVPLKMLMLLFTLPIFIFVTHPQFSILKIIKRSYQLFCQKPLAILGLYFIASLVWWVYSFYIVYFIDQFIIDFSHNFSHDPLFLYSAFYYLYDPIIKGMIMLFTLLSILIAYYKIAKAIDNL